MSVNLNLYEFGKGMLDQVDKHKVREGLVYALHGCTEKREYKNATQTTVYEVNEAFKETIIVTNDQGERGFAVDTNDCVRDKFPSNTLARVLIKEGDYIINAFSDEALGSIVNLLIMRVVLLKPENNFENGRADVLVKVIKNRVIASPTDLDDMGIFEKAVNHTFAVFNNPLGEFLTAKYSSNPGRRIAYHLFELDVNAELVSYLESGQKLVINRKSAEVYKSNGEMARTALLRCFYSKQFANEQTIFIDGYALILLTKNEISEYLEYSNLSKYRAKTVLKKIKTKWGAEFYAITNSMGEIRPIYRTSTGFSSFALNEYECTYIHECLPVDL